jgi:hypothetical protein
MKEIVPGRPGRPSLMRGPDGLVYLVSRKAGAVSGRPDDLVTEGPAAPSAARIADAARARDDLRKKLGYLPQLPVVPC